MALRTKIQQTVSRLSRIQEDQQGQDLIEYALLLGFMVIAIFVVLPNDLMPAVSMVFSKVMTVLTTLGGA